MTVGIIGAGSIGMLIGSYLAEAGVNVTLLVRNEAQRKRLNAEGICRVNEDGSETKTVVTATMDFEDIATVDLLIVAVKYRDVVVILQKLKDLKVHAPLLFIQNGLAHLSVVQEQDFPYVAFATVEHGALKKDDCTVLHNGVGKITIGERFGDPLKFDILERVYTEQFPVIRHRDASYILLRKVLINCLINPLTTILNVPNGQLVENPDAHKLMGALYVELIGAFPEMEEGLSFEAVELICQQTARNHSSMLTDYNAGRLMEIDTIVSAVIQKAESREKSLPLLQTYEHILLVLDGKAKRS